MNILLCSDNNYAQHVATTISSIVYNCENVNFFIFTTNFSKLNELKLTQFIEGKKSHVNFIYIDDFLVKHFPMSSLASSHISITTYLRLFAEVMLPKDIKKVIYLDSDIIVRQSLIELWEIELDNFAVAAVYQNNEWAINNNSYKRLGYEEKYGYFNAGVLLINIQ